jgi:uncharacterized protein DUF6232
MDAHLLYESDDANVSRKIVRLGETSYQVANICSVGISETRRLHVITILLAIASVVAFVYAYLQYGRDEQMMLWAAGGGVAGLLAALIWQNFLPKREYQLVLTTAAGEAPAFTTPGKDVFKLKSAVEDAFTMRG